MSNLVLHGTEIHSIFQLLGYNENDISYSTAWTLSKCEKMLKIFIQDILGFDNFDNDDVEILVQEYEKNKGITDIEIKCGVDFFIIIEAKRGWLLPSKRQLEMYSTRESITKSLATNKLIVTLSECSRDYASHNLEIKNANGIEIKHVSWKDIYSYAGMAYPDVSNNEKKLLRELQIYLRGLMSMQNITSNEVFVVSVSTGKPESFGLSWIDIVEKRNKYFHPMGMNGWPKEPPNYIAFRYYGKLQSIHHIEGYTVVKNLHDVIPEMPDEEKEDAYFIYDLGPAIRPAKEVKTGNIYASGRVWCHLDTLLTCDTISEARDISKERKEL
jgi:hypothetical protein